jgi:DNA invertase Pin-like site-specific DNA recombinase
VFHGLLKQDELVNHKDFDTHNNRASNLERSSYQHNRSYSEQRGRYAILQSEGFSKKIRGIVRKSHRARLTMKKAREIRKAYADGVGVEELAAKYGCGLTTIWDVIKNKTWIKV